MYSGNESISEIYSFKKTLGYKEQEKYSAFATVNKMFIKWSFSHLSAPVRGRNWFMPFLKHSESWETTHEIREKTLIGLKLFYIVISTVGIT